MKKIIVMVFLVLIVIVITFGIVVTKNNNYLNKMQKIVLDNYKISDNIKYFNKSDSYYILITDKNLIVLSDYYEEILKEDVSKMKKFDKKYEVVYRFNKVMYEVKKLTKNKVIYNYYDVFTLDKEETLEVGG